LHDEAVHQRRAGCCCLQSITARFEAAANFRYPLFVDPARRPPERWLDAIAAVRRVAG
jgi:hypothetical protein